jgi:hypothetical protein
VQPVKTNCGNTIRLVRVGFYGVTKIELYNFTVKKSLKMISFFALVVRP